MEFMKRPYVICHMTVSVDGKVTGDFLSENGCEKAIELYYEINRNFGADAYACGRVTMNESFAHDHEPDLSRYAGKAMPRTDFVADGDAEKYAVAFDRKGRLGWQSAAIVDEDPGYGDARIIEVLCEDVQDSYLAYLQSIDVSYIFAGKDEMDLNVALEKLHSLFGIEKLLLEGGSVLNGAFERANVIDELSLVQAPIVAGAEGKPLFDGSVMADYRLKGVQQKDGALWLRYKKVKNA